MNKKLFLGASIGSCVHVAGAIHFLNMAADEGYETLFLGPALSVPDLMEKVRQLRPALVTVGFRLTPENVLPLLRLLKQENEKLPEKPRWVFGGTRPVAELVRKEAGDFFEKIYDGTEDLDDTISFLRGMQHGGNSAVYEDSLIARMAAKKPYPLLRHHFGLPDFESTRQGIAQIAQSGVLDVISLGPDQNTQQFFFHPEQRDPAMDGAGGVPIRTEADFRALKQASLDGNHPLLRCYSGTAEVFRMAQLLQDTIHNAWCAVPLCWYNELDGRGTRTLEQSMDEAQRLMAWHGERGIPVEVNEPHHWALRDAHDVIAVAMAYISAYNAKRYGVKDYVAQYMFNVPNSLSFSMDLAKALAQAELAESLKDRDFRVYREVRAGLPFLSSDLDAAKGQLAASTYLSMAMAPDIIHVVGYSEAEHAATPQVVIESCKIVRGVIRSTLYGAPDATKDEAVQARKRELVREADFLIRFIKEWYSPFSDDPLSDAAVLSDCIRRGILDAPHIVKGERFRGILETRVVDGKCVAWDAAHKKALSEAERIEQLKQNGNFQSALLKAGKAG